MVVKAVLRKGPQEYHSAPEDLLARCRAKARHRARCENEKRAKRGRKTKKRTGERRSAVVEALELGGSVVDHVAAGKDVGLADGALAIATTTTII